MAGEKLYQASMAALASAPAALTDAQKAIVTGNDPTGALQDVTLGKDIPLFIGGQALIGARPIEGPFLYTEADVNLCDMIVDLGIMATPTATREIREITLNGTTSWTLADGWLGPAFAGMEVNFLFGSETQTPLASSIARFGSWALAYRSHAVMEIKRIPLAVFNNVVPWGAGYLYETENISRNAALTKLARHLRFDDTEFEFDVSGTDAFWISIKKATMMQYFQDLRATIGRNWNILTTEKLRIFENSAADGVTFNITRANTAKRSIAVKRAAPGLVPPRRGLGFVDIERDNDFNTVFADLNRFPLPTIAPQDGTIFELPIGMNSSDATFYVNRALLIDDLARKQLSCTGMDALIGAEPGDIGLFDDDNNISLLGRVTRLRRRASDHGIDLEHEQIDFSHLTQFAPRITSDGGDATAAINVVENTLAVTTVTASDINHDLLTFSISGGDDAALFAIDSATGVLTFVDPPDYETPADDNTDNVYEVTVQVSDGTLTDSQAISVTVTDVSEGGSVVMITEDEESMLTEDGEPMATEG